MTVPMEMKKLEIESAAWIGYRSAYTSRPFRGRPVLIEYESAAAAMAADAQATAADPDADAACDAAPKDAHCSGSRRGGQPGDACCDEHRARRLDPGGAFCRPEFGAGAKLLLDFYRIPAVNQWVKKRNENDQKL